MSQTTSPRERASVANSSVAKREQRRQTSAAQGDFDESKHPRGKQGTSEGGEFVKAGSSGDATKSVQQAVGAKADGEFGAKTKAAVQRFQKRKGLTVDGVVGKQTAAALLGRKDAADVTTGALTSGQRAKLRHGKLREETGKPGTNFKQVGPGEKAKLSPLMKHYGKMAHPFTQCVRDNRKRFGDRAERVCAVLKDLIRGTTKWRNQEEAMGALLEAADGDVDGLVAMYRDDLGRRLDAVIEHVGWEALALVLVERKGGELRDEIAALAEAYRDCPGEPTALNAVISLAEDLARTDDEILLELSLRGLRRAVTPSGGGGRRKYNRVGSGHDTGGQFSKVPVAAIGRHLAKAAGGSYVPDRGEHRERSRPSAPRPRGPEAYDRAHRTATQKPEVTRAKAERDRAALARKVSPSKSKGAGRMPEPTPKVSVRKAPTPTEQGALAQGKLPQRGDLYFNVDETDLRNRYGPVEFQRAVPLEKIKPVRARPEGIANAEPHMAKAAKGEGGKRDPITLVRKPDGSFEVYDGNSTFAIASKHGWGSVPAIIVDSPEEGDRIEQIAKAEKRQRKRAVKVKAAKAEAKVQREHRMAEIDEEIEAIGRPEDAVKAKQDFDTFDEMYDSAVKTNPELEALLTSVAGAIDGAEAKMGPLKERANALKKVIRKRYDRTFGEGRGHNGLADITRGTVLVESYQEMNDVYEELRRQAEAKGWKIVDFDNRISKPTKAGYADLQLGLQTPSGTIAEVQISTHVLNQAKQGPGHKWFEAQRDMEKLAVERGDVDENGDPVFEGSEKEKYEKLLRQQKGLYTGAAIKSYGLDEISGTRASASTAKATLLKGPQGALWNRVQTGEISRAEAERIARSKGYRGVLAKLGKAEPVGPVARRAKATPRGAEGSSGPWVDVGDDIEQAAKLLGEGKRVRLNQPRQVSTLVNRLAEIVNEAKAKGEQAPSFDLCNVTVPGTNLFCVKSKGIPRVKMPQVSGRPRPGSKGEKLADKNGYVDLTAQFQKHLADKGISIEITNEKASRLRASQNQLNGAKVAGMAGVLDRGEKLGGDPNIFVSRDNYVVDGHHRWAANVAHDLADDRIGDVEMPIRRVDMSIIELLAEANAFAEDWGIPQADVSAPSTYGRKLTDDEKMDRVAAETARRSRKRPDGTLRQKALAEAEIVREIARRKAGCGCN